MSDGIAKSSRYTISINMPQANLGLQPWVCLGLLWGTGAPTMMPDGMDSYLFDSKCDTLADNMEACLPSGLIAFQAPATEAAPQAGEACSTQPPKAPLLITISTF